MNVRRAILDQFRRSRTEPFVWGTADCLCFTAACAQPIIGRDPIEHLRGRYDSETSARRLMVAEGWGDMGAVAASLFPEIPVAQARAGDWAWLINVDGTDALGVVCGETIAAKGKDGMCQVPLGQAKKAFRVG